MTATETVREVETIFDDWLTYADVAEMFDRSKLTIMIWKKDRGLPCIRIKGRARDTIRFKKSEVLKWAKENQVEVA